MSSKREAVLVALDKVLKVALRKTPCRTYGRGLVLPSTIPDGGLMILRDGNPGDPEHTLSPLAYHYQHRAELEVFVQDAGDRDNPFDRLLVVVSGALAADRTLGGLCDWVEPQAPEPQDLPIVGGAAIKAAVVPVILHYTTSDPLS